MSLATAKQGCLVFQRPATLGGSTTQNHEAQFLMFHAENPHVYQNLVRMARQYQVRNRTTRIGIATLWEVLRWDYMINTEHKDYKLNNNHKAFYARMIMDCNPDLAGMFELRAQKA